MRILMLSTDYTPNPYGAVRVHVAELSTRVRNLGV
jgi:hypothetical protein